MGKKAQRKRREKASRRALPEEAPAQKRRLVRPLLLAGIPILTLALAIGARTLLDSRPAAGMVALLGILSWIALIAGVVGQRIPRRTRQSASGIGFGRR